MGDVIHALPAITDAANAMNNFTCDWVVEEGFAEIPSWHKNVNRVIPIALRRWRKQLLSKQTLHEARTFLKELRAEQYDYIIDAQGLIKSAILTTIARGPGYGMDRKTVRDHPLVSLFYRRRVHIPKEQHAITRIRQLFAKTLGYELPNTAPDYRIKTAINKTTPEEQYLIFIHGTSRAEKCWPETYWLELAKLATINGYKIKLPWGNAQEQQRALRISEQCPQTSTLPKTSLSEIKQILNNATAAVAVDTGLGHLAAALELPTIAIYGPTKPKLIGTLGKNQYHLCSEKYLHNFSDCNPQRVWSKLQQII